MISTYLALIIILVVVFFLIRKKIIDRRIFIEGIVIGVVAGVIIAYVTTADFRASIHYPWIWLARSVNGQVKYVSKNWANIKVTKVSEEAKIFDVRATNLTSGIIVEYNDVGLSILPPDLRYAIASGDVTINISLPNNNDMPDTK